MKQIVGVKANKLKLSVMETIQSEEFWSSKIGYVGFESNVCLSRKGKRSGQAKFYSPTKRRLAPKHCVMIRRSLFSGGALAKLDKGKTLNASIGT